MWSSDGGSGSGKDDDGDGGCGDDDDDDDDDDYCGGNDLWSWSLNAYVDYGRPRQAALEAVIDW